MEMIIPRTPTLDPLDAELEGLSQEDLRRLAADQIRRIRVRPISTDLPLQTDSLGREELRSKRAHRSSSARLTRSTTSQRLEMPVGPKGSNRGSLTSQAMFKTLREH